MTTTAAPPSATLPSPKPEKTTPKQGRIPFTHAMLGRHALRPVVWQDAEQRDIHGCTTQRGGARSGRIRKGLAGCASPDTHQTRMQCRLSQRVFT